MYQQLFSMEKVEKQTQEFLSKSILNSESQNASWGETKKSFPTSNAMAEQEKLFFLGFKEINKKK